MTVKVQKEDFDPAQEMIGFGGEAGAHVTFTGIVRDLPDAPLKEMVIEHYPAMTVSALEEMEAEAQRRWVLSDSLIIHRYGTLRPGERIMMVATASRHRKEAFEAAEFLMDYLKSRAPFWKKEITQEGEVWVESKSQDEDALSRWK